MKQKSRKFQTGEFFKKNSIFIETANEEDVYLGYISGLAATNHKDLYKDIITDEALVKGAKQLGGATTFKDHNYNVGSAVGKVLSSEFVLDGEMSGIKIKVGISKVETDLWTKIQEGIVNAFSIGGIFTDVDYDEKSDTYYIKDFDLLEVSVVGLPANKEATFGSLAADFVKSHQDLREEAKEKLEKEKIKEDIVMADEPEYVNGLKALADQLDKIDASSKNRDEAMNQITEHLKKMNDVYAPILKEHVDKVELAERKTAMIAKEKEKFENMSYDDKLVYEMRKIIETTLDPTVDEVLLMGDFDFTWPIHYRDYDELRKEKARLKVR